MGFCTTCGSRKGENGLCLKCDPAPRVAPPPVAPPPAAPGGHYGAGQPGPAPQGYQPPPGPHGGYGQPPHGQPTYGHPPHGHGYPPHGYPPHGYPTPGYVQAMKSDYMQDVIAVIKGFFTKSPEDVFDRVYQSTHHIWIAFAGLFGLLFGLSVIQMPAVILREFAIWLNDLFGGIMFWGAPPTLREMREGMAEVIPAFEFFFRGLLFALALFFIIYGVVKLITTVLKPQDPPASVLNMVGVGMFPVSLCVLAGLIFSFVSGSFAILLMSLGSILGYVYQIVGIHRIYKRIPYWAVVVGTLLYYLAVYLLLRFIIMSAMEDLFRYF